jgi:uncharacterized protein (DUF58 family)
MNLTLRSRLIDSLLRRDRVESAPVVLDRRRIYILPTKHGLAFALMLVLLLIGSINYALSLGFLLTFLLAGVALIGMLHTYRNMAGVIVRWLRPEPVFAGAMAAFPLLLETSGVALRVGINVSTMHGTTQLVDIHDGVAPVQLAVPAPQRGLLRLPRIKLLTRYPLGLFRAWSWIAPDATCVVYPTPAATTIPFPAPAAADGKGAAHTLGDDEFRHLRPYQLGDSPRRIAWRAYARERGLLTKQFSGEAGGDLWLDWNDAPESAVEAKLSRLTRWVLDADALAITYGLRVPGASVAPARGEGHRQACLRILAVYGQGTDTP